MQSTVEQLTSAYDNYYEWSVDLTGSLARLFNY